MNKFKFDFAQWSDLAKNDPEAFEIQRTEVINALLDSLNSDKEHRLRRMQWRLDRIRDLAKTPLAACMEMSQMMWNNVMGEGGLMDVLEGYRLGCHSGYQRGQVSAPQQDPASSATILPFRPRQD